MKPFTPIDLVISLLGGASKSRILLEVIFGMTQD